MKDGVSLPGETGDDAASLPNGGTRPPIDTPMDLPRIERAVRDILAAIGEDPDRDGLRDTPIRVARMYAEVCEGLHDDPAEHLTATFEAGHDEMVMVRDIPLYSLCEHHLVPFNGKATWRTSRAPTGASQVCPRSLGSSRATAAARRCRRSSRCRSPTPWSATLEPRGVMVVIEAEHLCMSMRGVQKAGSTTVTSAVRGLFRDSVATREEAMRFIHGHR